MSISVGHHGVDGAYAFQVLPVLARSQASVVLGALEPMLRESAPESSRPSASRPERTLLHMSADERVLSEAVDGVEIDVVVPPDHAPLARQTLAYGLSGLIVPLVGMVTLPIFARVFTPSEYGLLELGTATLTVAVAITDAGLTAAALRSFYDYTAEQEPERRSVMLTGFLATSAIALAVALLIGRFATSSPAGCSSEPDEETLLIAIACSVLALNTWRYVGEVMRVRFQAFSYLTMSALAATVTTALGVVGVLAFDWRVNGVFFAAVVGNPIAAVYGVLAVRRWLDGRFSTPELRRCSPTGCRWSRARCPPGRSRWSTASSSRGSAASRGRRVRGREPARAPAADRHDRLPVCAQPVPALDVLGGPGTGEGGPWPDAHLPDVHPRAGGAGADAFAKEIIEVVAPSSTTRTWRSGRWRSARPPTGSRRCSRPVSRSCARPFTSQR